MSELIDEVPGMPASEARPEPPHAGENITLDPDQITPAAKAKAMAKAKAAVERTGTAKSVAEAYNAYLEGNQQAVEPVATDSPDMITEADVPQ